MLKLTKYELRKNLLSIGIVAGIICVLQALFMFFCLTENLNYTSLFGGLLIIAASVSYFIVFIFGVVTYYRELSSKSSYLIFMTPNSSLSIITSKLLYTLIIGIGISAIFIGFGVLDIFMIQLPCRTRRLKDLSQLYYSVSLHMQQLRFLLCCLNFIRIQTAYPRH